jgi:hypothetical protein
MAVMDYQTRDGLAHYGFSIEFRSDIGWRIYIIFQPFLNQAGNDRIELPYQSVDGDGRRYVDWRAKLDSLGDARTVAALWAELSHRYLHIQARKRFVPAGAGPAGDELSYGEPGSGYPYDRSAIPHPRIAATSLHDSQENQPPGAANKVA